MKKSYLLRIIFVCALLMHGGFSPKNAAAGSVEILSSIRPIHALVLAVTDGITKPELLIEAGISAHNFNLKSSDAKKIEKSKIVFWIGPEMERSLAKPISTIGANANVITLMNEPSISFIPYTTNDDDDVHDHAGKNDPHIWLSTENAIAIVAVIENTLMQADPANSAAYAKNAKVAINRIKTLKRQMEKFLQPVKEIPFVVQHDGFAYLVREFGLNQIGNITNVRGSDAGAKHISELKKIIIDKQAKCIFTEPQMASQLAKSISLDSGVKLDELDAMGIDIEESPTLYVRIMQKNARALLNCLGSGTKTG